MFISVPNEITDKQIKDYKEIYFEIFGEMLSNEEASEQGLNLIQLVAIVLQDS